MRLLTACAVAMCMALPSVASANPNVLLIIADDMGLDASLCYDVGDQQAPMPNLERMCADGMVFDNAYSAPVCSPTRATIMTGQYGFRTGVGAAIARDGGIGLSAEETSLFDVLNGTGYASAVIGKWHLAGSDATVDHPAELGVTDYFGVFSGATRDYFNWTAIENGEQVQVSGYATTVLTDRAIDWIVAQNTPWFLWLAYNAPHAPFHLPPTDLHSFGDLPTDEDAIAADRLPYYNAALEALDTEMGRLLSSMPADVRDNTVVIFIGDNGSPNQVARDVYGVRDAKGTIFEGGTHIPFIVHGPDVAAGRTDALVNTTDIFATVAGFADVDAPTADAFDLRPILSGGSGARDYAYVEHFSPAGPDRGDVFGWALRDDRYKLVAVDGQDPMLFDLTADPLEQTDLLAGGGSDSAREAAARLLAAYETIVAN